MRKRIGFLCGVILTFVLTLSAGLAFAFAKADGSAGGATVSIGQTISVADESVIYENNNTGLGDNNGTKHRFADNGNYFTYKAALGEDKDYAYAELTLYGSSNRSVKVSSDNATWTEVHYSGYQHESVTYTSEGDYRYLKIALTGFAAENGDVYVRICAHDTNSGNGGDLYAISFIKIVTPTIQVAANASTQVDLNDTSLFYEVSGTNTATMNGTTHRWADDSQYFAYKANYENAASTAKYLRVFYKGTNRAVSVSADGTDYTVIGCAGDEDKAAYKSGNDTRGYYCYYDLTDYASNGVVYVKFGARNTSSGNGADVFYVEFTDGAPENYGQSSEKGIDMTENTMIKEISVTDMGIAEINGAGILIYDKKFALSAKNKDSFTYSVKLPENVDASRVYIRIETRGSQNMLEASEDGEVFAEISSVKAYENISFYSLADYASSEGVWVRFSSKEKTESGAESFLLSLTVYADRNYNATVEMPAHKLEQTTEIVAGSEGEAYISDMSNGEGGMDNGWRYFDDVKYGVYKFTYNAEAVVLTLDVRIKNGYRISVSSDGSQWKDVALGDVKYVRGGVELEEENVTVILADIVEKTGTLYVKIGDATSADGGWGGSFKSIKLTSVLAEEYSLFAEATLSLEDLVYVNYYLTVNAKYGTQSAVTESGLYLSDTAFISGTEAGVTCSALTEADGKYKGHTDGIAAKEIGDTIYAKLYVVVDGERLETDVFAYSPKTYAMNKLNNAETSDKLKDLCLALLDYGAAAQSYFGYNTESLANAEVASEIREAVEIYRQSVYGSDGQYSTSGVTFAYQAQMTLMLEGKVSANCYVTAEDATEVSILIYDSAEASEAKQTLTATEINGDVYKFTFDSVSAKELGDDVCFVISVTTENGTEESSRIAYGAATYAYNKIASASASQEIKALCKSMLDYAAAAQMYFGYNTDSLANRYL